jgi:hypothetical protein
LFTSFLGIDEIGFRISSILFCFVFISIISSYLKLNYTQIFLVFTFYFLFDFESNNVQVVDQAHYLPYFIIALLLTYNKIPLKHLSLLVGVSILFRFTGLILFFVPVLFAFKGVVNNFKGKWKELFPLIIGMPLLFKAFVEGTPSTDSSNNFQLFSETFYNTILKPEIFIFLVLFVAYFILKKRFKIVFLTFIIFTLYLIMLARTPFSFSNKYYFEIFSGLIAFSILSIIFNINKKQEKLFYLISITAILLFNFFYKNNYSVNKNYLREIAVQENYNFSNKLIFPTESKNFQNLMLYSTYKQYKSNFKNQAKYLKCFNLKKSSLQVGRIPSLKLLLNSLDTTCLTFMKNTPKKIFFLRNYTSLDALKSNTFISRNYKLKFNDSFTECIKK